MFAAGAPDIPANKPSGILFNPRFQLNVPSNIFSAGAPDIPANKPAGIDDSPESQKV